MDFASLMKSQISSSLPPTKTQREDTPSNSTKYLKRSEIEAQRQADYQRDQEVLETARLERLNKKRRRDEEETERNAAREAKRKRLAEESRKIAEEEAEVEEAARRKRIGLPALEKMSDDSDAGIVDGGDIEDSDLKEKLKAMDEPRLLFGETHPQRLRRYRKLLVLALALPLSTGPIPTTLELVEEKDMKVPSILPSEEDGKAYLRRQLASYFDMVLTAWASALARRPREVQDSFSGKQAFNSYLSALSNLEPLFRKLESVSATTSLPDTLLAPILEIVDLAQQKRYVHANDAYLRLSIGKAAWPIGVTMVGIHERSAREKLHESDKGSGKEAHILADETTRKMLQGIKRCLSFAQTRWPPEDVGQLMG